MSGGTLQDQTKIKVAIRVRPLQEHEINAGHETGRFQIDKNTINVRGEERSKAYRFDQVFDMNTRQSEVYKGLNIQQMVHKVVEGYHATIFAYGQTGSGKTFTMEGNKYIKAQEQADGNRVTKGPVINKDPDVEQLGITYRSVSDLFREIKRVKEADGKHINVFCSFLQIYNERVYDLLNETSLQNTKLKNAQGIPQQGLRIRWTKKEQFVVENLYVNECQTTSDVVALFNQGIKNKVVASHNLNHASSRSHTIFTITVETVDPSNLDNVVTSKLQLVDLAGSEKISATGTTGQTQKESITINQSLFTLRKVINRLSELSSQGRECDETHHVPYRDSKLTSLLKQSLGGNSYCLMIACISPSDKYYEESVSTLNYAQRAANISNQPVKNVDPKIRIINELKHKVRMLQIELKNANDHIAYLTNLTNEQPKAFGLQLMKVEDDYIDLGDGQKIKLEPFDIDKAQQNNKITNSGFNSIPNDQEQLGRMQNERQQPDLLIKNKSLPQKKKQQAIKMIDNNQDDMNFINEFLNNNASQAQQKVQAHAKVYPLNIPSSTANQSPNILKQNPQQQQQSSKLQTIQLQQLSIQNHQKANTDSRSQSKSPVMTYKEQVENDNERLVQSVSKVTELLQANQYLRDEIEKLSKGNESKDNEIYTITQENLGLRERIEILENIIRANKQEYENLVSAKVINNMEKSTFDYHGGTKGKQTSIDTVYQELIELREHNRILEKRVKTLEKQNIDITKNLDFVGNSEPARPMVQQQRKVKKMNYNDDSEQSDYDYAGGYNNGRGDSVSKSLHKVQSTPQMKMQIQQYQHQLNHHPNSELMQDGDHLSQFRITQMSKNSTGSQVGIGQLTQNQWYQMKNNKQTHELRQSNPRMSGMAMLDQAVLQNARIAGDMGGAVMPPMPRDNKRSYQDLGAQPTLAQLMRKKR
eukprot:403347757